MNTKRIAYITTILTAAILYATFSILFYRHDLTINIYDVVAESLLASLTVGLLIFSQRFKGPKRVYYTMTIGGTLAFYSFTADILDEFCCQPRLLSYFSEDLILVIALIFFAGAVYFSEKHNASVVTKLYTEANTDRLTNVGNRGFLSSQLTRFCKKSERYGTLLSVIMLDIDHFKEVNDVHGHVVGDSVLQELSRLITSEIREFDILCRYGGEEFIIILPETNLYGATITAEKLRHSVECHKFSGVPSVTASFGVSQRHKKEMALELVKRVDKELYMAKNNGRNQVSPYPTAEQHPSIKHRRSSAQQSSQPQPSLS